jgi:hypothetical protein
MYGVNTKLVSYVFKHNSKSILGNYMCLYYLW